jgi:CDP-diacylglycerol--glycerol-3-phosphate 3-phosphatidyltransferase
MPEKTFWEQMTIPNYITFFRILLIPVFIVSLYMPWNNSNAYSAILFVFIALTDNLDGYLARKLNQVSDLGKLLDPLADKLLVSAALIFLIGREPVGVPTWIAYLILTREFLITGLRSIDHKKLILSASYWGKFKTFFEVVGILAVLLNFEWSVWILVIAVVLSWVSGIDYILKGKQLLKEI